MNTRQYARYQSAVQPIDSYQPGSPLISAGSQVPSTGPQTPSTGSQHPKNIEDALMETPHVCTNCIDPIEVTGPSRPTTYIYVDGTGTVQQKISRPTNKIFARFMSKSASAEADSPPVSTPKKTSLFEVLSEDLSKKSTTANEDDIERIVRERVDERLRSMSTQAFISERGVLDEMSTTSLHTDSKTGSHIDHLMFTPFFNNELYATYDCSASINNNAELKFKVELAGLLSSLPIIYPFGNKRHFTREYPHQKLDISWSNESSKGRARCFLDWKNDVYVLTFDRIVREKETNVYEEIKFEDIALPAFFTYEGTLSH